MSLRRKVSSKMSAAVLDYVLKEKQLTQEQLADALEVSAGFISRVRTQERSLTIDHLMALERIAGVPLGALLLAAVPLPKSTPATQKLHDLIRQAIAVGDEATECIRLHTSKAVSHESRPAVNSVRFRTWQASGSEEVSP